MGVIFEWFDRSPAIRELLKWVSTSLASKRGLPIIAAIAITVVSLVVHIVAALNNSVLLSICGFTLLHLAILLGFIGVLLAEPLGRGS
ncbi:MAG TPA: hypothetical protein VKQ72_20640 [Aggregatilineales bacterium]|nr:hypothetical protein [Aggregatilineales bacterium]